MPKKQKKAADDRSADTGLSSLAHVSQEIWTDSTTFKTA